MENILIVLGLIVVYVVIDTIRFKDIKKVSVSELKEVMSKKDKNNMYVDVREPDEYRSGKIKGFVNIPVMSISNQLGKFSKENHIYVICQSGSRSKSAARKLYKAGYKDVITVKGGMSQWRN